MLKIRNAKHPSLLPHPTIWSTKGMSYRAKERRFACDASDLKGQGWIQRLFNDAADGGIILESHKTGKQLMFTLQEEERDYEGEIQKWVFTSHCMPFNGDDQLDYTLVVWND